MAKLITPAQVLSVTEKKREKKVAFPIAAKLVTIRRNTGIVLPKCILNYFGIVNLDAWTVNISIIERGLRLEFEHKENEARAGGEVHHYSPLPQDGELLPENREKSALELSPEGLP